MKNFIVVFFDVTKKVCYDSVPYQLFLFRLDFKDEVSKNFANPLKSLSYKPLAQI